MPQRRRGAYGNMKRTCRLICVCVCVCVCVFQGEACSCMCHTVGHGDDKTSVKSVCTQFQLLVGVCERVRSVRYVDTWHSFVARSDLWLEIWRVVLMMVVVWWPLCWTSDSQFLISAQEVWCEVRTHEASRARCWGLIRLDLDAVVLFSMCAAFRRELAGLFGSVLAPPAERKDANCPTKRPLVNLRADTIHNLTANTHCAAE